MKNFTKLAIYSMIMIILLFFMPKNISQFIFMMLGIMFLNEKLDNLLEKNFK